MTRYEKLIGEEEEAVIREMIDFLRGRERDPEKIKNAVYNNVMASRLGIRNKISGDNYDKLMKEMNDIIYDTGLLGKLWD